MGGGRERKKGERKERVHSLPLSLYSRGSSCLDFMLNADDAREPAYSGLKEEDDSLSIPFAGAATGLAFSSPIKFTPLLLGTAAAAVAVLLTNGLRKGGMVVFFGARGREREERRGRKEKKKPPCSKFFFLFFFFLLVLLIIIIIFSFLFFFLEIREVNNKKEGGRRGWIGRRRNV